MAHSTVHLIILVLAVFQINGINDWEIEQDEADAYSHLLRERNHRKDQHRNYAHTSNIKYGKSLKGNGNKYSDKKQLTAFLLSFVFFGAGRIYVEHFIIGSIQMCLLQLLLFLIWIVTVISCFFRNAFGDQERNRNNENTPTGYMRQWMLLSIFYVPLFLIVSIWWIHDIASFSMNDIADANGLKLQPW